VTNGAALLFHQKGSTEISDTIVTGLAHSELDAPSSSESGSRFTALGQRLEEAAQAARDDRDAVVASFDVIIARSEHRRNQIMKVLALVTVLFLPGSFLVGLMSVNFKLGLFSNGAYFWVLVCVIAASAIAMLATARVRGWI
jgi:Mg2+ and Co2+ transporter CorA